MINSTKLLPNRIGRDSSLLSDRSAINLDTTRKKLVNIDGLLKEKLVLSKVRESVKKQEEERVKRLRMETFLERDDDDDISDGGLRTRRLKPDSGGGPFAAIGSSLVAIVSPVARILGTSRVLSVASATLNGFARVLSLGLRAGFAMVTGVEKVLPKSLSAKGVATLSRFGNVFSTLATTVVTAAAGLATARALGVKSPRQLQNLNKSLSQLRNRQIRKVAQLPARVKVSRPITSAIFPEQNKRFNPIVKQFRPGKTTISPDEINISGIIFNRKRIVDEIGIDVKKFVTPEEVDFKTMTLKRDFRIKVNDDFSGEGLFYKTREVPISRYKSFKKRLLKTPEFKSLSNAEQIEVERRILEARLDKKTMEELGYDSLKSVIGKGRKGLSRFQILKAQAGLFKTRALKFINPRNIARRSIIDAKRSRQIAGRVIRDTGKVGLKAAIKPYSKTLTRVFGKIPIVGALIAFAVNKFLLDMPVPQAAFIAAIETLVATLLGGAAFFLGGPLGAFLGSVGGGILGEKLGKFLFNKIIMQRTGVEGKKLYKRPSKIGDKLTEEGVEVFKETDPNVVSKFYEGNERFFYNKGGESIELREVIIDNQQRLVPKEKFRYIKKLFKKATKVSFNPSDLESYAYYEDGGEGTSSFVDIPIASASNSSSQGGVIPIGGAQTDDESFSSLYAGGLV